MISPTYLRLCSCLILQTIGVRITLLGPLLVGTSTMPIINSGKRKPDDQLSAAKMGDNKKAKKPLTNERREERNMREKERSLKITQQIQELRNLLSMGGVIVPKVSCCFQQHSNRAMGQ